MSKGLVGFELVIYDLSFSQCVYHGEMRGGSTLEVMRR
jgi:hypothetical protein